MRQPQNDKHDKENVTVTINKKKSTRKSKRAANHRYSYVTIENLECINDDLCFHKAYGVHGTWKLVPKDSCLVYKNRKQQDSIKTNKEKSNGKRPAPPGRKGTGRKEPSSERDVSFTDEESSRYSREQPVRKAARRVKRTTKKRNQKQRPKRPSSDESMSSRSYTTCSETNRSSTRSSDMES